MDRLTKSYQQYKSGNGDLKMADFKIDLELDEINKFKTKELEEFKSLLPKSAFDYIKNIRKGMSRSMRMDSRGKGENSLEKSSGFPFDQKEIESE